MTHIKFRLLALALMLFSCSVHARNNNLNDILALPSAPPGVVIEIVTPEAGGLKWALPEAQNTVALLRTKFTDLPIAIVTHGREQFALTKKLQPAYQAEHKIVQSLMKDDKVEVHVCGTHAEWKGVHPEDFPAYVDVTAAGPAQINDYKSLGYLLLVIRSR